MEDIDVLYCGEMGTMHEFKLNDVYEVSAEEVR